MTSGSFASFVSALTDGDAAKIATHYHANARSYGPLAWPAVGAAAIAERLAAVTARLDTLEIELHDAFTDAQQERAALRLVRRWTESGSRLAAIETHYLRLADGRIVEEFTGPNTFQIADRELNSWGLTPADTSADPCAEILAASENQTSGKQPQTVPERFVSAFGGNDPDALLDLYAPGFVLYSPIAWGLAGRDPLVPFVQQFHHGFPGLRLALFDQFASGDGSPRGISLTAAGGRQDRGAGSHRRFVLHSAVRADRVAPRIPNRHRRPQPDPAPHRPLSRCGQAVTGSLIPEVCARAAATHASRQFGDLVYRAGAAGTAGRDLGSQASGRGSCQLRSPSRVIASG